jgi:hypothetical protein
MQQNYFNLPTDNPPLYPTYNYAGVTDNTISDDMAANSGYQANPSDQSNPLFISTLSWEYFSNELEFE